MEQDWVEVEEACFKASNPQVLVLPARDIILLYHLAVGFNNSLFSAASGAQSGITWSGSWQLDCSTKQLRTKRKGLG